MLGTCEDSHFPTRLSGGQREGITSKGPLGLAEQLTEMKASVFSLNDLGMIQNGWQSTSHQLKHGRGDGDNLSIMVNDCLLLVSTNRKLLIASMPTSNLYG